MYARLDQASARTGLPVNSIVIAACLDWLQRHTPPTEVSGIAPHRLMPETFREGSQFRQAPRWATVRREEGPAGRAPAPRMGGVSVSAFQRPRRQPAKAAQVAAEKSIHCYQRSNELDNDVVR